MLDMSLMRGVWVDPAARIARAQAGCLLGDVDRETQLHGLAAVLGFVSATGIAGLTLGGGFGYLTRRFGWTSDNVRLDGRRHRGRPSGAREREGEPRPLLGPARRRRQLRRRHRLRVRALSRSARRSSAAPSPGVPSHAPEVLALYRELADAAPPELTLRRCACASRRRRRGSPRSRTAQPIVALFVCHTGPLDEAEKLRGADQVVRQAGRRHRCSAGRTCRSRACSTRPSPRAAATTGSPSTCPGSSPSCSRSSIEHAERIVSPHSARSCLPDGRRARTTCPPTTRRWATGTPRRCSTSRVVGASRTTTPPTSSGRARPGGTCAASRPAAPTSTSSPRRRRTSGSRAAYGDELSSGSSRSRRTGIPPNLFRANKNIAPRELTAGTFRRASTAPPVSSRHTRGTWGAFARGANRGLQFSGLRTESARRPVCPATPARPLASHWKRPAPHDAVVDAFGEAGGTSCLNVSPQPC